MSSTACAGGPEASDGQRPEVLAAVSPAIEKRNEGPPQLKFVSPADGAVVKGPFVVEVDTENMDLAPAGFSKDGEGHFHIRVGNGCLNPGEVLPKDETTVHVGSGESSAELDLPPGTYELCAQVGDGFHVAVNVTDSITVRVVE